MTEAKVPALDEYWQVLESRLPNFSREEQHAAIALYRALATGHPVDAERFGRALGISATSGHALLQRDSIKPLVYLDDRGSILGFGGLAATAMHHRFEVGDCTLSTWCAWDSLFLPEILDRPARVTSADPESGEVVRLVVTPERIESVEPGETVVSFVLPDVGIFDVSAANVMAKFCHFVFFFASRSSGERWTASRPGTFLYSLDDAFALARRLNARNFGPELERLAQGRSTASPSGPTRHLQNPLNTRA
ncbi:organomercurial lyase [Mesorhizobium sp.]|uniref:organomercurial lyase n=1 Tax=Mesorhizobium sp. TaxID=1871066 RepID=UPI0025DC857F|nr:organomercurial lyase [Mesorhizobium sp.]